jgi:ABC-2 type transport system permease protein
MREIAVMTLADLRQRVRDRTVLIFGLLVPFGLMFVFNLVFTTDTGDIELEPITVAASADAADPLASALLRTLSDLDVLDVTVRRVPADEVRTAVTEGDAAVGLVVPTAFAADLQAGRPTRVDVVEGDNAGLESDVVVAVVQASLERFHAGAVAAQAAAGAGVPQQQLGDVAEAAASGEGGLDLVEGEAGNEQLSSSGALVAGQAGLFLMFTVGFGVLALLAEREGGTLARLHSMPMRRSAVITAKALSGFVLGVGATTVLLTAGSVMFGVDFGFLPAIAALVLCAVAAATSLTFVVARVARNAEQANIAQSIIAMVLGVAGGAFFPLAASGVVGRLLDLNPVAALTRGLGITAGGGGLGDIGPPVGILLGFALACTVVSRLVPDRTGRP